MLGAIAYQFYTIKIVMASNDMFLGIYSGRFADLGNYCDKIGKVLARVFVVWQGFWAILSYYVNKLKIIII